MKREKVDYKFVEYIPDDLEEGVVYISGEFAVTAHLCCCGCGREVSGVHKSATVADIGHGLRSPRVDNLQPDRRQRAGDASSPDPGDSAVVSHHEPFGAAIDVPEVDAARNWQRLLFVPML